MALRLKQHSVLPGFGLTMGFTLLYMTLLLLIPLGGLVLAATQMSFSEFWAKGIAHPRVLAAYRLSFGASLVGALLNAVFGFIVAWVLVRYSFPGKRLIDAIVDLPFALPTAVSGIALTTLYARTGWIGKWFDMIGIQIAYTWVGIVIALTLIGLPFVVRTLQPALEDLEKEIEEASASLGASRLQTFRRVIFPAVLPALLTGFALAFARALGEYGSVIFIAGNMPGRTEIAPLLVVVRLEDYDYNGATAISVVMLTAAFILLLAINLLQWWSRRYQG
ncbi:sulfate ABC transporter permease subunit CysT [Phycisphaerales bacterium AB-hyl4]|uniref:Sulfate transport system permease protein CysT n=1 Tax=Natronomicrosphaera hydrolytica TaxID=3242702 RepID=A0ABV4U3C9_9BACT